MICKKGVSLIDFQKLASCDSRLYISRMSILDKLISAICAWLRLVGESCNFENVDLLQINNDYLKAKVSCRKHLF
jgi:hypothetical protein